MASSSRTLQLLLGFLLSLAAAKLDASSSESHNSLPPCATWCVCKDGPEAVLQKTLDYACGHGADCNPIKASGACFSPDSMRAHCSYAVNSYFHKMHKSGATCDFSTTATLIYSDPSSSGCSYPAIEASSSGSTTPVTTPPKTTPTTPHTSPTYGKTPPTTSSPYTGFPPPGVGYGSGMGPPGVGYGSGMGPPGMGLYDDNTARRIMLPTATVACSVVAILTLHLWN